MEPSSESASSGSSATATVSARSRRLALSAPLRRIFDIVCSFLGLLALSPFFLLIAIMIKLSDGGSIFYLQQRVGRNFKPFALFKFRTMVAGADLKGLITTDNDARITRVGRTLRKYKLDELPQLLNVFRGDMQLVGPRPESQRYVEIFRAEYAVLLRERPGITDPASIAYRNENQLLCPQNVEQQYTQEILPRKLRLSLEYAARRTFFSDVRMIFRTLFPKQSSTAPWPEESAR